MENRMVYLSEKSKKSLRVACAHFEVFKIEFLVHLKKDRKEIYKDKFCNIENKIYSSTFSSMYIYYAYLGTIIRDMLKYKNKSLENLIRENAPTLFTEINIRNNQKCELQLVLNGFRNWLFHAVDNFFENRYYEIINNDIVDLILKAEKELFDFINNKLLCGNLEFEKNFSVDKPPEQNENHKDIESAFYKYIYSFYEYEQSKVFISEIDVEINKFRQICHLEMSITLLASCVETIKNLNNIELITIMNNNCFLKDLFDIRDNTVDIFIKHKTKELSYVKNDLNLLTQELYLFFQQNNDIKILIKNFVDGNLKTFLF